MRLCGNQSWKDRFHFLNDKFSQEYFEDYYVIFSSCKVVQQFYFFDSSHNQEILQLLKIMYYPLDPTFSLCAGWLANADFCVGDVFAVMVQNEDYLRRKFKTAMGMSPHTYLESLRIENAKKLLSQPDELGMTIFDVSYLSGFYDNLFFRFEVFIFFI